MVIFVSVCVYLWAAPSITQYKSDVFKWKTQDLNLLSLFFITYL